MPVSVTYCPLCNIAGVLTGSELETFPLATVVVP
ncbi:MAG: DUF3179 domain-containing protein [Acidimicrobiia bacterium]|nr:DUF3179 domain-containing protein [Acidimicrobiia bacterium]